MKYTAALAAIASLLLLAACGGGGGGTSSRSEPPPQPAGQQALNRAGTANAAAAQDAIGDAGKANPQFGSVFQASASSATTAATFDGSRLTLSVANTLNLNSGSHSLGSTSVGTPVAGHTGRSWGLAHATANSLSGAAVLVSWDEDNTADWLAGGYWLHVTGDLNARTVTSVAAGAFVDGPEFQDRSSMPSTGTATYSGVAGGIYAYGGPSGGVEVGEVLGTVDLTASFSGAGSIGGSISGIGDGVAITLEPTSFQNTGRIDTGNVDLTVNGRTFDNAGKWGGRFSSTDDDGVPRLVAGTAGAEWEEGNGVKGAFVGAFVATKQ